MELLTYTEPLLLEDSRSNKWRRLNKDKAKEHQVNWKKEHPDYHTEWKTNNPDKLKQYALERSKNKESAKKWYEENKEYISKWYEENSDKVKARSMKQYEKNSVKIKEDNKKLYSENPDKFKKRTSQYEKSTLGKLSRGKTNDYRKRNLGSELINNWFEGCNRHHINKNDIICIPKELHRLYPHNHKKPETMIEINRIAFEYLTNDISQL